MVNWGETVRGGSHFSLLIFNFDILKNMGNEGVDNVALIVVQ